MRNDFYGPNTTSLDRRARLLRRSDASVVRRPGFCPPSLDQAPSKAGFFPSRRRGSTEPEGQALLNSVVPQADRGRGGGGATKPPGSGESTIGDDREPLKTLLLEGEDAPPCCPTAERSFHQTPVLAFSDTRASIKTDDKGLAHWGHPYWLPAIRPGRASQRLPKRVPSGGPISCGRGGLRRDSCRGSF